jgi:hypothetical protein
MIKVTELASMRPMSVNVTTPVSYTFKTPFNRAFYADTQRPF